jgi:hypothetical protein
MTREGRNPKAEIRKKPEIRIPNEIVSLDAEDSKSLVRVSNFGFPSAFGFRPSDF